MCQTICLLVKKSFFSATAKQSGVKYKETTFTIGPCVQIISSAQYRSGSSVEVTDAVRYKVCENARESFRSDVWKQEKGKE